MNSFWWYFIKRSQFWIILISRKIMSSSKSSQNLPWIYCGLLPLCQPLLRQWTPWHTPFSKIDFTKNMSGCILKFHFVNEVLKDSCGFGCSCTFASLFEDLNFDSILSSSCWSSPTIAMISFGIFTPKFWYTEKRNKCFVYFDFWRKYYAFVSQFKLRGLLSKLRESSLFWFHLTNVNAFRFV